MMISQKSNVPLFATLSAQFIGYLFGLIAMILPLSCHLNPSGIAKQQAAGPSHITFNIAQALLTTLAQATGLPATGVEVRVFGVLDDKSRGSQEGPTTSFAINQEGIYTINELALGWKEFEVTIYADETVLAVGSKQHLVVAGAQTIEDLVVKLVNKKPLALAIVVAVSGESPSEEPLNLADLTEPETVRTIFQSHQCVVCHMNETLNFTAFPYQSATRDLTGIVQETIKRVQGQGGGIMPPFGSPLTASEVATLKDFLAIIEADSEPPPAPGIEVQSVQAIVSGPGFSQEVALDLQASEDSWMNDQSTAPEVFGGLTYQCEFVIKGTDDIVLAHIAKSDCAVDDEGGYAATIPISVMAPQVTIKVTIE